MIARDGRIPAIAKASHHRLLMVPVGELDIDDPNLLDVFVVIGVDALNADLHGNRWQTSPGYPAISLDWGSG